MRSASPWFGLLLFLTAVPAFADEKPAATDKDKGPQAAEKDKLVSLGNVAGVVETVPGEDSVLKVKVTIRYLEANVQAQANLLRDEQQLLTRQQNAMQIRNPVRRQQEFARILQSAQNMGQANLFTVKEVKRDVEFEMGDDAKIRTANPPTAFDDKGNPKEYTKAELKELKGPEGLPGYPAERDALQKGQTVIVAAARRRPAAGEKELADEKPLATMVVIVADK